MEATSRLETISSNIHLIIKEFNETKRPISILTDTNESISCIVESFKGDGTFQIKIKDNAKKKLLIPNKEYSVGCGGKDGEIYSFITKCLEDGATETTLSVPSEVKITEQRTHKRINTLNMKNPYLELVLEDGAPGPIYILNDLSKGGLSFLVPKHLEETVKIGDRILVKRMGKQEFIEPLLGIIIHKTPLGTKSSTTFRVGVRFLETANL